MDDYDGSRERDWMISRQRSHRIVSFYQLALNFFRIFFEAIRGRWPPKTANPAICIHVAEVPVVPPHTPRVPLEMEGTTPMYSSQQGRPGQCCFGGTYFILHDL